jgi:RNA polymerase sigma-70 factor (ECF subfamily)
MIMAHDDAALVDAARGGSARAREDLFSRHWSTVWKRAYAITGRRAAADDIAQDAFIRAFSSLNSFDGRSTFATWLHRIVVNRAIDVLRAERRLVSLDAVPERADLWTDTAEDETDLRAAVAELSPDRRVPVVLRYWLDLTPMEIAKILDVPVGTVNSRLARALADLRARLGVTDAV